MRQSSGSRVAVEWQSSGSRFLQAVVAGGCYVCNRSAAGDDLGVLRGKTIVLGEDVRMCGPCLYWKGGTLFVSNFVF